MAKYSKTGGRDFQPGESGNPAGRPVDPPDIKVARRLGQVEFERVANKYLYMSVEKLTAKWKSTKTRGFDRMILGIILRGAKGDVKAMSFIADRLIGKVKSVVEVSGIGGSPIETQLTFLSDDELHARREAILAKYKK